MRFSKLAGYVVLICFCIAVIAPNSNAANTHKYPTTGGVVKAKVFGIDQLYVCTAEVPYIYVNARVPYAPAKNLVVVAPAKVVAATGNSPPVHQY